jgi:hypothetical protein
LRAGGDSVNTPAQLSSSFVEGDVAQIFFVKFFSLPFKNKISDFFLSKFRTVLNLKPAVREERKWVVNKMWTVLRNFCGGKKYGAGFTDQI